MRFLRIGIAGIRGKVGPALTPIIAEDFAAAFGTYVNSDTVIIARDTRISSETLYHALVTGLLSTGCRIIDTGICPAPVVHFAVNHTNASGGLLLGGGHHPAEWNAIVALDANGAYFSKVKMQELLNIYHSKHYISQSWNKLGTIEYTHHKYIERYLKHMASFINVNAIRKAKFTVVVDFCNGSGSKLTPFLENLFGIKIIAINDILSGILPHEPEPRPRSSFQVRSLVKALGADAGFVFNSDMSRTAIVTDTYETLSEEYTYPIAVDYLLKTQKVANIIVTNICTTRMLDDIVRKYNAILYKTKVGQAYLIDAMFEQNADIAGDGSGSLTVKKITPGFDGLLAMGIILEAMAVSKKKLSEIVDSLPRYNIIKRTIPYPTISGYKLIRKIRETFSRAQYCELDGIRFDWKDGWLHLRISMTEPIIRMITEWKKKEDAEDIALRVRSLLTTPLTEI